MKNAARMIGWALVLAATLAIGQEETKAKLSSGAPKKPVQTTPGPVTLGEMHATIEQLEIAIRRVVLANNQPPVGHNLAAERPATRVEIINEFWRLYQLAKPSFKFTPRPVVLQLKSITIPSEDAARRPLETMIKHGFIGKVAPLASNEGPNMTVAEYGDALGFFLARIGDLTHTPSAKWSPYMFNHKDGG
ncbi:MAG TPA: hypothetical protein PLX06_08500 [Fimbriimonadaceae bacterium]|nr:hypothetical protein [Fimbriimonadaceae bacterium]